MAKKGKKITPKMEKELKDIDAMLNNVGAMGDDVDQMASGLKDL
jgi:hypothetical protein